MGSDWGNAVFTAFSPELEERWPLPPPDLPLPRSVGQVAVKLADGRELEVLGTHFHHVATDHAVRDVQARHVVSSFAPSGTGQILLGDLNATPDSECLAILEAAGWRDVGSDPTYPARDPVRRIDVILTRGPLRAERAWVAPSWGSDHRAVVAECVVLTE